MSKSQIQPAWVDALLDKDLTSTEFRMVAYLTWRQGRNRSAWPSQETIAAEMGLTPEGVRKIAARLEAKNWIRIHRPSSGGRGRCIHYSVIPPKPQPAVDPSDKETPASEAEKPPTAVGPLAGETPNGATEKPQPAVWPFQSKPQPAVWPSDEETPDSGTKKPQTAGCAYMRTLTKNTYKCADFIFNLATRRFVGISEADRSDWAEAFPGADIDRELVKAAIWWRNNPTKHKKDIRRFLTNWLARAEHGFGDHKTTQNPEPAPLVRDADGLTPRERILAGSKPR